MSCPEVKFVWKARLLRVIDGDTFDVSLDVGFRSTRTERLRLLGVNCPERHGPTAQAGLFAKEFTERWFVNASLVLTVETFKSDVFGRYLARVYRADGRCLNDDLLKAGHAVPWKRRDADVKDVKNETPPTKE
jgi:micrococcal nuclease